MPTYLSPGVYVEEVEAGSRPIEGVSTAVAAFVGLAEKGPVNEPTLVSNWTQFSDAFGGFLPNSYLAHSVYGYFLNGGGNSYIVRIGADGDGAASNGRRPKQAATKQLAAAATAAVGGYRVTALPGAPDNKTLAVEVAEVTGENVPEDVFKLVVSVDGKASETYEPVSIKRGKDNVVTKVRETSKLISIEEVASGSGLMKPDRGSVELVTPEAPPPTPAPERISGGDLVGDASDRTGFSGLEAVDEVTMVAVPD